VRQPLDLIDAHTHVVSGDGDRYPMHSSVGADQEWHRERPVDTDALLSEADAAEVRGVVLVQSLSCHGYDNRYVLDSARRFGGRAVAIGAADPADPDAVASLRREVIEGGMRGVRLSPQGETPSFDHPSIRALAAEAADLDVPVVLIGGPVQLPSVKRLAAILTTVRFVVDHCGFADLHGDATFPGAGPLLALSESPNVVCKVSSINLQGTAHAQALWSSLVAHFGSERLLWGSDYPHSDGPGYAELVRLACTTTEGLGAREQADVLGGAARRLWPSLS
jgi:L-fuconolactonase